MDQLYDWFRLQSNLCGESELRLVCLLNDLRGVQHLKGYHATIVAGINDYSGLISSLSQNRV